MKTTTREIFISELILFFVCFVTSIILFWPIHDMPIIGFFIGTIMLYVFSWVMYILFQLTVAFFAAIYHFFKGN